MSSHVRGGRRGGLGALAHEEGGHNDDERWLLTYSDMITLLLALFIIMWSISSVNISKFDELKVSLKSAFSGKLLPASQSILSGSTAPLSLDGRPVSPVVQDQGDSGSTTQASSNAATAAEAQAASRTQPVVVQPQISAAIQQAAVNADADNLKKIQEQVQAYARAHGFADKVKTSIDERGLTVRLLTDNLLFASGSAILRPDSFGLLAELSHLLTRADIVNPVRVEGNTDSRPIHSAAYPSNWELSTARADAVLEFLLAHRVKPGRLSVAGYGAEHPVATNATAAGQSANRRVDIVILRRSFN